MYLFYLRRLDLENEAVGRGGAWDVSVLTSDDIATPPKKEYKVLSRV